MDTNIDIQNKQGFRNLDITYEEFVAMFELLYNIVINTPTMPKHTIVWVKGLADKLGFVKKNIDGVDAMIEENTQIPDQNSVPNKPDMIIKNDNPPYIPDLESLGLPPIDSEYMKALEKMKKLKNS